MPRWHWTNYGRDKLCLFGCLGSEPRLALSQTAGLQHFRRTGEAAAPGGRECGPCPDFASYTPAFALQLRKITENLRVAERRSADPKAIRFVDMAIVDDGLNWPLPPFAYASGDWDNPRLA